MPERAILLAAGYGTRMRPLSNVQPKCLMPLWNVPLIERHLRMLEVWGIREALINLHHAPDAIVTALRQRKGALRLNFSFEPEILGTGGALRRAAWFIGNRPFWMLNTDIAMEVPPDPFPRDWRQARAIAVLWGTAARGPRTVQVDHGNVTDFRSRSPGIPGTMTFCGLQLVSPELLRWIPEGFSTVIAAYEAAMQAGHAVRMIDPPGTYWDDMGTPERYLAAHGEIARLAYEGRAGAALYDPEAERSRRRLRRRGVTVDGWVAVPPTVTADAGATLRDCVVWPSVHIPAEADIDGGILARTPAAGRVSGGVVTAAAAWREDPAVCWALDTMGWAADRTCCMTFPPRGSDRSFLRLAQGGERVILIRYGTERRENRRHAGHARYLAAHGIPVPEPLAHAPRLRCVLERDGGDVSIEDRAHTGGLDAVLPHYRALMPIVARLHACPLAPLRGRLEPAFGAKVYQWEHALFETWFLRAILELDASACGAIRRELRQVARQLRAVSPVLVHRDLQSSNVLIDGDGIRLIDFQGMRRGPAAYDLAALLCDPYVMLPTAYRSELLDLYRLHAGADVCTDPVFHAASVQRLVQALGAYGRLSRKAGLKRFDRWVAPACAMLGQVLDGLPSLPALRAVAMAGLR